MTKADIKAYFSWGEEFSTMGFTRENLKREAWKKACGHKQIEIDELKEENKKLKSLVEGK